MTPPTCVVVNGLNIASVTYNSVGHYTVHFTNPLSTLVYGVQATVSAGTAMADPIIASIDSSRALGNFDVNVLAGNASAWADPVGFVVSVYA